MLDVLPKVGNLIGSREQTVKKGFESRSHVTFFVTRAVDSHLLEVFDCPIWGSRTYVVQAQSTAKRPNAGAA